MNIYDLNELQKARILKINIPLSLNYERLKVLGIVEGEEIEIIKYSPYKNSIIICIKNSFVAMCKEVAQKIIVEVL